MLLHQEGLRYYQSEINNFLGRISQSSLANDVHFRQRFAENLPISGFSQELALFTELQKHMRNIEHHLKTDENVLNRMRVAAEGTLDKAIIEDIKTRIREMEEKYMELIEKVEVIKGLLRLVENTKREDRVKLIISDAETFRFTSVYEQLWTTLWSLKESLEELRQQSTNLAKLLLRYRAKLQEKLDYLKAAEDKLSDFETNVTSWLKFVSQEVR